MNPNSSLNHKSMLARLLLVAISAVVGFGLGSSWKRHSSRIIVQPAAPSEAVAVSPSSAGIKSGPRGSELAAQLEEDLRHASPVTKWLCWASSLEKAKPSDFPHLARLAASNKAALRFVVKRWIQIDPRGLFDAIIAGSKTGDKTLANFSYELINAWVKQDPEAVISALNETSDVGIRKGLRMDVATAVFDQNPERGLQLMADWSIDHYGPSVKSVKAWTDANPQHAAEFTLNHSSGYASQLTIDAVGKEWAAIDPVSALNYAVSQRGDLASRLSASVLKEWAARDLQSAADWLSQADPSKRNELSAAFVETWGKQDATAALAWCEENLQGIPLSQAISGLVRGAADKDLSTAAALVAQLEPGQPRAEAAAVIGQKWFPEWDSKGPPTASELQWLAGLDSASIHAVLQANHWQWERADAQSLAAFLSTVSSDTVPAYVDSSLAQTWARTSPADALAWAAALPSDRGLQAGGAAFEVWREAQPEQAMGWYNGLPADDPRRPSLFETMIRALAYQPQGAQQIAAMSPSDQAAAQSIFAKMKLSDDVRSRLDAVLKKQ